MRHGNLRNAFRSFRLRTSETSIFATEAEGLDDLMARLEEFKQRLQHLFLLKNEIGQQHVESCELDPEKPNGHSHEKENKEEKHARVRHQQSPPFERRSRVISVAGLQPSRDLV